MAKIYTTLNFFQIVPADTDRASLAEIRDQLFALKDVQFKKMPNSGKILTMPDKLNSSGSYFLGAIYSVQMKAIPPSMDTETDEIAGLNLDVNKGLAKATCFLIDPQANILVVESGTGASEKAICAFLKFNNPKMPNIEPALCINPGQIQRFYDMTTVVDFELRLARVNDGSLFTDPGDMAISQIIHAADNTNTDKLTYKIEINPQNRKHDKSLNKGWVADIIKNAIKYKGTPEVEKIQVKGKIGGEDKISVIELVKERMFDEIEYEIEDRLIQTYNIPARLEQIDEKYGRHRTSLLRSYKIE